MLMGFDLCEIKTTKQQQKQRDNEEFNLQSDYGLRPKHAKYRKLVLNRRHQQQRRQQQHRRLIFLLGALILLQQIDSNTCRSVSQASDGSSSQYHEALIMSRTDRRSHRIPHLAPTHHLNEDAYGGGGEDANADASTASKRSQADDEGDEGGGINTRSGIGIRDNANIKHHIADGQPEEIFRVDEALDTNYDEYPMIVPKRAALLLDRLMVALHRALEKERTGEQERLSGLHNKNKNFGGNSKAHDDKSVKNQEIPSGPPPQIPDAMYSDDDPSAFMDYDFKDLNSINRATGETLMAKSFQRRANVNGLSAAATDNNMHPSSFYVGTATNSNNNNNIGSGRLQLGRMYWRCYFNAVSCF